MMDIDVVILVSKIIIFIESNIRNTQILSFLVANPGLRQMVSPWIDVNNEYNVMVVIVTWSRCYSD